MDVKNFIVQVLHQISNLASFKTEDDKLDIDKLVLVLVGLRKLSDIVKNDAKNCVWLISCKSK